MRKCLSILVICCLLSSMIHADQSIQANGLVFHTDQEKPQLEPGEIAVFPYSDEAAILLSLASQIKEKRGMSFDLVVDPFCGDGKSGLPIVFHHIAKKLSGSDINLRAIHYAIENASLNHLEGKSSFSVHDIIQQGLQSSEAPGNTLWIANPPFALKAKGAALEVMRDGGENGLTLTLAFVEQSLAVSQPGDVILGIGYSRIHKDGSIELEQALTPLASKHGGKLELTLLEEQKLWRAFNGKKEQMNPMPISEEVFALKADPSNPQEVNAYHQAAQAHNQAGFTQLGYYAYTIYR